LNFRRISRGFIHRSQAIDNAPQSSKALVNRISVTRISMPRSDNIEQLDAFLTARLCEIGIVVTH
jgi:hypothetical protein